MPYVWCVWCVHGSNNTRPSYSGQCSCISEDPLNSGGLFADALSLSFSLSLSLSLSLSRFAYLLQFDQQDWTGRGQVTVLSGTLPLHVMEA